MYDKKLYSTPKLFNPLAVMITTRSPTPRPLLSSPEIKEKSPEVKGLVSMNEMREEVNRVSLSSHQSTEIQSGTVSAVAVAIPAAKIPKHPPKLRLEIAMELSHPRGSKYMLLNPTIKCTATTKIIRKSVKFTKAAYHSYIRTLQYMRQAKHVKKINITFSKSDAGLAEDKSLLQSQSEVSGLGYIAPISDAKSETLSVPFVITEQDLRRLARESEAWRELCKRKYADDSSSTLSSVSQQVLMVAAETETDGGYVIIPSAYKSKEEHGAAEDNNKVLLEAEESSSTTSLTSTDSATGRREPPVVPPQDQQTLLTPHGVQYVFTGGSAISSNNEAGEAEHVIKPEVNVKQPKSNLPKKPIKLNKKGWKIGKALLMSLVKPAIRKPRKNKTNTVQRLCRSENFQRKPSPIKQRSPDKTAQWHKLPPLAGHNKACIHGLEPCICKGNGYLAGRSLFNPSNLSKKELPQITHKSKAVDWNVTKGCDQQTVEKEHYPCKLITGAKLCQNIKYLK